ncbi:transposase [Colletotrichum orchidophilum]|uniref:Transposase n=1 Tax=Colletotrichum orchidophilum TaxID=1209926 RepID=A0A1G4AT55_9PEZI|nr:transposase [Colletotrichum orchidophilum]OHE92286.1 transposase [Colletotrichum orchidophilum]
MDGHGSHVSDDFMWQCYSQGVYLCCLPAHSSHITQPLDVSVFSPLKSSFRTAIRECGLQLNSAPIGKQNFLRCYFQARNEALTVRNICSGWKATGLWPVDMSKPLLNPLLVIPAATDVPRPPPWDPLLPEVPKTPQDLHIITPKKSGDLRRYQKLWEVGEDKDDFDPISRKLIFDKVGKRLDAQNFALAHTQVVIQSLEAQVVLYKPISKGKVRQDPNERFVQIEAIMKTKKEVAARPQRQNTDLTAKRSASDTDFLSMCSEFQI